MKDVVLVGLGAVGTHFCKILTLKHTAAEDVRIVGVADSTAAIYLAQGFAPAELLRHKESHSLATYRPEAAVISCDSPLHLLDHPFHILIDATPANLIDGEPGVSCAKRALSKGKAVVCANKAPLVLQWSELHDIARRNEAQLKYSATVCGGLPGKVRCKFFSCCCTSVFELYYGWQWLTLGSETWYTRKLLKWRVF